jgi:signal transduction histidine kinase/ActR/RegA family two-component response regulator
MRVVPRLGERWRSGPAAIFAVAFALLLAGLGIIVQNEASYRSIKADETRVQADILAASVAAALDFNDPQAAQEAVDAFRANRQIRSIAIFDTGGAAVAGFHAAGRSAPASLGAVEPIKDGAIRAVVPVTGSGQSIGTVYFDVDREPISRRLTRYLLLGLLVTLAALVVVVLGLAQTALKRANRALGERAEALAEANVLLEVEMQERAKAEEQLRQAQKMQALGQLTGGIAHDFNNLLTVIQGSADMLCRENLPDHKRVRFAQAIVQASASAAALTSQLLAFARRQPLKPEPINLNSLIESMLDLIDRTLGERIQVVLNLSPAACNILADRNQLEAAILNVSANARDAMPDGGRLTITTRIVEEMDRPMTGLEITDTGTGMDEDTLEHVFEPFFTTKGTGKGTGLGLSQVFGFAQQSGGEVRAQSQPGVGTTLLILLPCSDAQEAGLSEDTGGRNELSGSASILVVEDNEEVGAFAEALLSELGHAIRRVHSGEAALDLIRRERFDIVLSDVVMPGMGGLKLAQILSEERPELPVVLATGYSQEIAQSGSHGRHVILKPYRLETLSTALARALGDEWRQRSEAVRGSPG